MKWGMPLGNQGNNGGSNLKKMQHEVETGVIRFMRIQGIFRRLVVMVPGECTEGSFGISASVFILFRNLANFKVLPEMPEEHFEWAYYCPQCFTLCR